MSRGFRPAWWARNPHVQTIVASLAPASAPPLDEEIFELPDGDFVQLNWLGRPAPGEPLVVILHGLEGDRQSGYVRRMLTACAERGLAAVVHHHRGCGGRQNRLARAYHSGDTADIALVLDALRDRFPDSPFWAVGYSLGANVICKYLGERAGDAHLARSAAVSPPLDLGACEARLRRGFSRVYQRYLIDQLRAKARKKMRDPAMAAAMPFDRADLRRARTFYDFDDIVTAPLHGFDGARDYYRRSSGMQFLAQVERPLLVLHAADDPFMTEAVIPPPEALSAHVTYEMWPKGGHVGFIEGGTPRNPRFFLERRLIDWLTAA